MADFTARISSLHNPRVKNLVRLNNRRHRDAAKLTVVEGRREVARALQAGIVPEEAYICPELWSGDDVVNDLIKELDQAGTKQIFEVTTALFEKIAYRGSSGGLLLVVPYLEHTFADLSGLKMPFLAVIDGVEKPGNLGAILRTADAAGVDALILTGELESGTDLHNPNVIRASLGAVFSTPVISTSVHSALSWLREQHIHIVATSPDARQLYTAVPLTGSIAVVLGSEAFGLGEEWLRSADSQVRIPMFGIVDSLNLSVSTALLLYEVVRQRSLDQNAAQ